VRNGAVRIVGSVLVRNEDVFVERAIRNVAEFCDRIHVLDHMSADATWEVLRTVARDLDHVELRRSRRAGGDELYDPAALRRLRETLLAGGHSDVFRLKGHVLNCDELDPVRRNAAGYMAPPSRPVTKLFYFGAVDSWTGGVERLHAGEAAFRAGYGMESLRYLSESLSWDDDPLRCLHVCFLPRSSHESAGAERRNLNESGAFDRTPWGTLKRRLRPPVPPRVAELHKAGSSWKRDWYARGDRVSMDATAFIAPA
jgi:hypothetical protein